MKIITFASAMNLIRRMKKKHLVPYIKRIDVYTNIDQNKNKFSRHFQRELTKIREKQIYDYMDELVEEKCFRVVSEMETRAGTIRDLASTPKAERLYEQLWISTNLTSKEDVGQIVTDAIRNMENLSDDEKDVIVKRTLEKIDEKRVSGFPFSIPKDIAKKLIAKDKKEKEEYAGRRKRRG